jgi:hypothetical protein
MKSSRCPLVACSDVMGSSVTDILGAAEALAPAVIGRSYRVPDPGNGSQSKTGKEISDAIPPPPGGVSGSAPDPISEKQKRKKGRRRHFLAFEPVIKAS